MSGWLVVVAECKKIIPCIVAAYAAAAVDARLGEVRGGTNAHSIMQRHSARLDRACVRDGGIYRDS